MQVSNSCLDIIFRKARTQNAWQNAHVPDGTLEAIYDLMKWGPTSFNSNPVRIVFCASPDSKKKLADCAWEGNQAKIIAAPITAIIAFDTQYYELLPKLFPLEQVEQIIKMYKETEGLAEVTAFRNSSLQGAYFIIATRALGLDCGPISGFSNDMVDQAFFSGTTIKSNFICSIGYGDPGGVWSRLPRPGFQDICRIE